MLFKKAVCLSVALLFILTSCGGLFKERVDYPIHRHEYEEISCDELKGRISALNSTCSQEERDLESKKTSNIFCIIGFLFIWPIGLMVDPTSIDEDNYMNCNEKLHAMKQVAIERGCYKSNRNEKERVEKEVKIEDEKAVKIQKPKVKREGVRYFDKHGNEVDGPLF